MFPVPNPPSGRYRVCIAGGGYYDINETSLARFKQWWSMQPQTPHDAVTLAFDDMTVTLVRQHITMLVMHGMQQMPGARDL